MKKRILIALLCILALTGFDTVLAETTETPNAVTVNNGIVAEDSGSYYYENGVKFLPETHGVYEKDGNHYYFDPNGAIKMVPQAGFYAIDNVTYYFNEDSSIKTVKSNGYKLIDGVYYYMKAPYMVDDSKARKIIFNDLKYYYTPEGDSITETDATITSLKRNGSRLELRAAAKQKVGGYDTLQGSCTDGTYAYYVLYNRNVEKCKIVKVRLSDNQVIKTSGVLKIHHGNGLTYNPDENVLVAVHNTVSPMKLSVIHPGTLKVKKTVTVKVPAKVDGATKDERNKIKGFGSISYNTEQGIYVMLLSGSHNLLLLDEYFTVMEYRKLSEKPDGLWQCIDTTEDHILIGLSPGGELSSNVICVYEWDGTYRFMIKVRDGYELESIFHIGKKLYAGFYRSSYNNRRNYVYKLSNIVWEI